ncbi:dUTP diphosphatase [Aeribacillus composti]|uniref:dUTP diphosphatase n=1 Tax=Aeribacillus composti TaxID=1868734 RepID=UPI002E23D6BE|nr:dUTP diphosphatase [Aeribacillus composti]
MKLQKLFELQRQLDERIEREHPRQEGEDRLAKKILALMVELGELANEWRGFKYWSNDQKPRTRKPIYNVLGGTIGHKNAVLEEYVDCLHFILSIGNEINMNEVYEDSSPKPVYLDDVIYQFMFVNQDITSLYYNRHNDDINGDIYDLIFSGFLGLGQMLGFTWEQIEAAYMQKNAENHRRQDSNY